MKLCVYTIVLNGMPWISSIFTTLNSLKLDWHWYVVEGAALNVNGSEHCNPINPQLSVDGTWGFLNMIKNHPRVTVIQSQLWHGKLEMVNTAVALIKDECVLMQMDSDEIWNAENISSLFNLMAPEEASISARFFCRYFVGPDLIVMGNDCYGNKPNEWTRAWKFSPGTLFTSHSPPILQNQNTLFNRHDTLEMGIGFDHYSWVTEQQVAFKEMYYQGHEGALEGWKRIQQVTEFPVKLKDYFPWADENAQVVKLC